MSVDLVKTGDYPVLAGESDAMLAAMEANLGGERVTQFDLDRYKVPGGGGLVWTSDDELAAPTKELSGIILNHRLVRTYWDTSLGSTGGGTAPTCYSDDSITGFGDPGGSCAGCQLATFGTAVKEDGSEGRGQACKQSRLIFLLQPGETLPVVVTIPPSSLQAMKRYLLRLVKRSLPVTAVVTTLSLAKDKNGDGIEFARVTPHVAGMVSEDDRPKVTALAAQLAPVFSAVRQDQDTSGVDLQG